MAEISSINAGRLSHAYLISAPSLEAARSMAVDIAMLAICTGQGKKPCGLCRACRKVSEGLHPDVITVRRLEDDKGKQKREISVDQIRALSTDACVLPNEAERKVYIIEEAETMNVSAQNTALKLLEEPPLGAMFLLCTANPGKLLPTVRSRCVELSRTEGEEEQDRELTELALGYIKAVSSGSRTKLFSWCSSNEGMDTRAAAEFIDCLMAVLGDMLCQRRKSSLEPLQLRKLYELADSCRKYLRFNVGVKHIFGLLAVDSIAGDGNRG